MDDDPELREALTEQLALHEEFEAIAVDTGTKGVQAAKAGQIDLVMTPIGGSAWVLGEDFLDKAIARRLEGATQNHFLIDFTRCALNPIRGGANILHGKAPWYRASRDAKQLYFSRHAQSAAVEVSEPGERR